MSERFEALIVGTGPAGAAAANVLARAGGLRVALVDAASLPRHKACGGIFPATLADDLGGLDGLPSDAVLDTISFTNRGAQPKDHHGHIIGVHRSAFDHALVERAVAAAHGDVAVFERFRVDALDEDAQGVGLTSREGHRLRGQVLIAADGAFSRIARLSGLNAGNIVRPALDLEIAVSDSDLARFAGALTLDLFEIGDGYGWVFPKSDRLSCGIVAWSGRANLNQALDRYLGWRLPGAWQVISRSGHGIPVYSTARPVARGRIMLAGDAANLAEPIYGAGIEAAVRSGIMAGQAALEVCQGDCLPEVATARYQAQLHRTIGRPIEAVHRHVSPIFRDRPKFFYRNFIEGVMSHEAFALRIAALGNMPALA